MNHAHPEVLIDTEVPIGGIFLKIPMIYLLF